MKESLSFMTTLDMDIKMVEVFNTLRPRQNGRHFVNNIFKCLFFIEYAWISLKISLKLVVKVWVNNIPSLVQITVWCRPGDRPLSEPMKVSLLAHIWFTQPQWVKELNESTHPSYIINTMAADDLVTQGARASAHPTKCLCDIETTPRHMNQNYICSPFFLRNIQGIMTKIPRGMTKMYTQLSLSAIRG